MKVFGVLRIVNWLETKAKKIFISEKQGIQMMILQISSIHNRNKFHSTSNKTTLIGLVQELKKLLHVLQQKIIIHLIPARISMLEF